MRLRFTSPQHLGISMPMLISFSLPVCCALHTYNYVPTSLKECRTPSVKGRHKHNPGNIDNHININLIDLLTKELPMREASLVCTNNSAKGAFIRNAQQRKGGDAQR